MTSFSGPADIYEALVENTIESTEWLGGLVAFSIVEEQKIEWMRHHAANNGSVPSDDEIRRWYLQQPQEVLLRARNAAEARLTEYAQESIDVFLAEFGKEIEQGIIVTEIRQMQKFWPQLGINIVGGIASSLLFAALLTLAAFLILNDSSPVTIGAKLGFDTKEATHVRER